ncbi:MAG: lamin tail domain-containing protein, partial [Planctomycetota bacterium]
MISLILVLLPLAPLPQNPEISELLASNQEGLMDEDGDRSDWIEIHNPGAADVDLGGYYLTDDVNDLIRWAIPSPTILAAGDFLIVFASDKNRAVSGLELHTDFKLTSSGEYLALVLPDGVTVQSEYAPGFPPQDEDISYGRRFQPGITLEESFFLTPTPGAANGTGGPLVRDVDHLPLLPSDLDDIVVTAEIDGANVPVVGATLIS